MMNVTYSLSSEAIQVSDPSKSILDTKALSPMHDFQFCNTPSNFLDPIDDKKAGWMKTFNYCAGELDVDNEMSNYTELAIVSATEWSHLSPFNECSTCKWITKLLKLTSQKVSVFGTRHIGKTCLVVQAP